MRGTIITTGDFSSGTKQSAFERGAAPITLIDGEKLLNLHRQHEIGVSKKAIEYFEFDQPSWRSSRRKGRMIRLRSVPSHHSISLSAAQLE